MRVASFDHTKARWDKYRAFHTEIVYLASRSRGSVRVVTFDTGEVMVAAATAGAELRSRPYKAHQFTIGTASELTQYIKLAYPNGEPVRASWIEAAALQILLYDHDSKHVVSTSYPLHSQWGVSVVPPRLRSVGQVYFAGDQCIPQAARPILTAQVTQPTIEERRHVRLLQSAARLWCQFESGHQYEIGDHWLAAGEVRCRREAIGIADVLNAQTLEVLDLPQRLQLASFGVRYTSTPVSVPYMIATPHTTTP